MANTLVSGPAGAGKSQMARQLRDESDGPVVIADFQAIHVALTGAERQPDGTYPLRDERLLPITEFTRQAVIGAAVARGISVIATNSDGDPERRAFLLGLLGPGAEERIVDPGRHVVEARLTGTMTLTLSADCEKAVRRWYDRL